MGNGISPDFILFLNTSSTRGKQSNESQKYNVNNRGGWGGGGGRERDRQTGRGCGMRGVYYTRVWLSMLDVEFCNLTNRSDLEPIFDMLVRVQSTEDEYKRAKVQCVYTVCLYAEPDSS